MRPPSFRPNNAERKLSGALIYAGGTFTQVIEGGEEEVHALFQTIRRDPRHHTVIVLDEGEAAAASSATGRWRSATSPGACTRRWGS